MANEKLFDQVKREPLLPESHYQRCLQFNEDMLIDPEIDQILSDSDKTEDHKKRLLWSQTYTSLELLIARYSAGESIESLQQYALRTFEFFKAYRERFPSYNKLLLWEPDAYQYVMWLLSLAVMLDLKEYVPQIASWISTEEDDGQDVLVHRLLERLGVSMPGESLIHEKPYVALLQATETTSADQQKAMTKYLKTWYSGMKNCYWHDRHKRLHAFFFGYWSFEAGLVTLLWNIDDSAYRDMPFYPKDMVDFARQQRAKPQTEQEKAHISARTGEACPHAGRWGVQESPDTMLQERMFKAGDTLPSGIGRDGKDGPVTWIVLSREDGGPTRVD
jgi:hypothetical protein